MFTYRDESVNCYVSTNLLRIFFSSLLNINIIFRLMRQRNCYKQTFHISNYVTRYQTGYRWFAGGAMRLKNRHFLDIWKN